MERSWLPSGKRHRDCYLDQHTDRGPFTDIEIRGLVAAGLEEFPLAVVDRPPALRKAASPAVPGRRMDDDVGVGFEEDDERDADAEAEETKADYVVKYLVPPEGAEIGDVVKVPETAAATAHGGHVIYTWTRRGSVVIAAECSTSGWEAIRDDFGKRAASGKTDAEPDLRTLPVKFDSAAERWRTVDESVLAYDEEDFEDFPIAGPRTLLRDCRQLRRQGRTFVRHHEEWRARSGVRHTDRSVHEHLALCRALHLLMCYDQVNLPNLAGCEAMNRRRTLIEKAHSGHPESPNYEGAEDYLGATETVDGTMADPALEAYVAGRQANKAQVHRQARLMREERESAGKAAGKQKNKKEKDDAA